jgi:hypothetical protein
MKTNLNPTFVVAASLALSACASFASQVEFKGLNNQTLGNATVLVDPAGGGLTISGIGTNGADGVSVATGGDGGGTFDLGKFNPAALPVGAWVRWRAVDPSDKELQKVTIQATASGGAFFADFTGLGAQTVSVGGMPWVPVVPCRYANGTLRTFYHSDYFRSAVRHADVPPFTDDERTLLDLYEAIANEPDLYLDMQFAPGDIQLVSNHLILHARTAYEDHVDPARRRHLLRLWLSLVS